MRKLYVLLLSFLMAFAANSQTVTVGTGTTTSGQSPWDVFYGYSYVQTIYLGSEINAVGSITSIQYYYAGTSLTNNQAIKVYMRTVARNAFASATDWEPLANLTLVYDGVVGTPTIPGWITITLTTPFAYNSTAGNLLIAIDENTASYDGSVRFNSTTVTPANRVLYYRNDVTNPDPATPPTGTTSSIIGNIKIDGLTLAGCQPVTGVAVSNVTTTGATATWTAPAGGSSVSQYNWEVRASGAAGSGATGLISSGNAAAASQALASLAPGTLYSFYVRSDCGNGSYSPWSAAITFTTVCVPYATPTSSAETFATYLPSSCWSEATGQLSASTTFTSTTSSFWAQDDFGNVTSPVNKAAGLNIYSTTRREWLISPSYNLGTSANKQLEFDLALTTFASTTANTLGADDEFVVVISTDDGVTWSDANTLRTWSSTTPISNTGEHIVIDLSAYTGVVKFGFYGESTVSNADNDIFVDNFAINVIPACAPPTGVMANTITNTSANIEWMPPSVAPASYDVFISTTNTSPTGSTTPTATGVSTPYTATSLSANTTYYVWVRGNCGGGLVSTWTILPISFITECNTATAINENFDAVTIPALPSCWKKIIRGTGIAAASITTATGNAHTTANSVSMYNSSAVAADDIILVSPILSNVGAGTHQLKFWGKNSSAANDVEIGTVDYSSGTPVFTVLQTIDLTTTYQQFIISFAGYAGTTGQHIGFRRLNATTFSYVYIDDVVWEAIPTCAEPTAINVTNITTTSGDVNWTPPAIAPGSYDVYYSTTNTPPTGSTTPAAVGVNPPYTISSLSANTTYYVWVRGNCGGTDVSTWSTVVSFSTACNSLTTFPLTESFEGVTSPAIPGCWQSVDNNNDGDKWITYNDVTYARTGTKSVGIYTDFNAGANNDYLILPPMTLPANMRLKYWMRARSSAEPNNYEVMISTTGTAPSDFTSIYLDTARLTTYTQRIVDLSGYSGNVYIALHVPTGSLDGYYLYMDDFTVEAIPSCLEPTNIVVSSITTTGAIIDWTAPSVTPASYDVYVSTSSTAPTGATTPTATAVTNPYTVGGLTASTTYYVWVRGNCGTGNVSVWSQVASFTTLCTSVNVPYTQNFDGVTAPALPGCITVENVNNDAYTWKTEASITGYTGNVASIRWNATAAMNDWLYTAGLNLTAGKSYVLKYKYGNNSTTFVEKMKIYFGTSASASGMTTELIDYPSINDNTPRTHVIRFTAPTTGVYYIGFYGYSAANQFNLYLDDISVTEAAVAATAVNSCVTVTAPGVDAQNNTKWMSLVDASGNIVGEINGNGNNLGAVSVKVYRHSGAIRQDLAGRYYMNRNIEITPTTQPATPVSVRLYFTAAEFTALQGQAGANVSTFTDISVFKNTDVCGSQVRAVASKLSTVTTQYEGSYVASFDVASFSSFYLAASTYSVLPANIVTFSGVRQGSVNQLKWTVAQEQDVLEYEVERSENAGRNWVKAATVASPGNTVSQRGYSFSDNSFGGLKQLYRLRQVDRNGMAKLSAIVSISGTKPAVLVLNGIFPNPASDKVNVLVEAPAKDNITLVVMDAVGRVVKTQKAGVEAGSNSLSVNLLGLTQGSYLLKVTCESNCETAVSKFVKE